MTSATFLLAICYFMMALGFLMVVIGIILIEIDWNILKNILSVFKRKKQ